MMNQTVYDTSEILRLLGVHSVVICPGSRNAPLTFSFAGNDNIKKYSLIDERSAAFVALGLAQSEGVPAAVCCTSGTAMLNFGPAAAEAIYSETPLLLISADRPPEWIDQQDGQTIRQHGALSSHVKKSFTLPHDLSHPDAVWEYKRKLSEAYHLANSHPKGPVHINIPFREPFYPEENQKLSFSSGMKVRTLANGQNMLSNGQLEKVHSEWSKFQKRIIVIGQGKWSKETLKALENFHQITGITIISDIISNGHELTDVITKQDLFLASKDKTANLKPDLVLTIGQSLISKQLKKFLREDTTHWHVGDHIDAADPFQNLEKLILHPVPEFFKFLASKRDDQSNYFSAWNEAEEHAKSVLSEKLEDVPFCDFSAFKTVMTSIPKGVNVHLANSMAVRYANFFTPKGKHDITFYANRGTSGIDGSNSTAVGMSLSNPFQQNLLLTGDLSFFYDRNAFLHEHDIDNLKIIVFNNNGGGIFDLIPGPDQLNVRDKKTFFQTAHNRSFQSFAQEFSMSYSFADSQQSLQRNLENLFTSKKSTLVEISTDDEVNKLIYKEVKKLFQ